MVTASTYLKEQHFRSKQRLDYLQDELFSRCLGADLYLEAWAIFSNHYHIIVRGEGENLRVMLHELHRCTSADLNRHEGMQGRRVWYQYWDTELTFERSILARLRYVHQNPVKHGLVPEAHWYRWCSARWFMENARPVFQRTLAGFKIDRIKVEDAYEPVEPE